MKELAVANVIINVCTDFVGLCDAMLWEGAVNSYMKGMGILN